MKRILIGILVSILALSIHAQSAIADKEYEYIELTQAQIDSIKSIDERYRSKFRDVDQEKISGHDKGVKKMKLAKERRSILIPILKKDAKIQSKILDDVLNDKIMLNKTKQLLTYKEMLRIMDEQMDLLEREYSQGLAELKNITQSKAELKMRQKELKADYETLKVTLKVRKANIQAQYVYH